MQQPDAYNNPLGFGGIEPAENPALDSQMQALFDLNLAFAKTFGTPHGKKVLAWLRNATIESSAWSPALAQTTTLGAANAHAYAREGQNALVRDIESRIALASDCKTAEDLINKLKGGLGNGG